MVEINKELITELFDQAVSNSRFRQNYDLRTSSEDGGQRMLNALMPGTVVPIHRHPNSNENVIIICGKLVEILFDEDGNEIKRYLLDPAVGNFGCVVPASMWHTVEVLESSVIYEAKDGPYGQDGSETLENYKTKKEQNLSQTSLTSLSPSTFSNSLGDLKKNIEYIIGMERQSGSMDVISPLYVSRMLNLSLDIVEKTMRQMNL